MEGDIPRSEIDRVIRRARLEPRFTPSARDMYLGSLVILNLDIYSQLCPKDYTCISFTLLFKTSSTTSSTPTSNDTVAY